MSEITDQVSSSIDALTKEFEIIAHNLANVSTAGFKRRCNAFSQYLDAQEAGTETYTPGSIELNSAFDFSQGNIVETDRPLDFALHGKGFFVIETPDGPLYTRNGIFLTNQNGQIVDFQGRIVAGEAGPITIPNDGGIPQVRVSSNGSISIGGTTVGKFQLVDFEDKNNKWFKIAWELCEYDPYDYMDMELPLPTDVDGTYEFCGIVVNGNPDKLNGLYFIKHGCHQITAKIMWDKVTYGNCKNYLSEKRIEGIVWHHIDGRMAKIKCVDFGLDWNGR